MAGPTPAGEPGGETETSFEIKNTGVKSPVRPRLPALSGDRPPPCPASSPEKQAGPGLRESAAPRPSRSLNFGLGKLDSFSDTSQFFVIRDSLAGQFLPANTHSHPHGKYLPWTARTRPGTFPERPRWPNRPARGWQGGQLWEPPGSGKLTPSPLPGGPLQTSRAGNTAARKSS